MIYLRLPLRRLNHLALNPLRFPCHPQLSAVPLLCSQQHKRHSSNWVSSAYYIFSPDLPPIYALQVFLETVHSWSHLPWWAVIVGSTVVLRSIVTVPLAVHQNKLLTTIELSQPTLQMMTEALKVRVAGEGRRMNLSAEQAHRKFRKEQRKLIYNYYKSEGLTPMKLYILPLTQLPLWFFLSLSIRNLTGFFPWQNNEGAEKILPCPEMTTEGTLWFSNLTIADPTLILPFAVGIFNLLNIELNALRRHEATTFHQMVTNTLRFVSVGMIFVASQVPTAMCLYWAVSGTHVA
ncbi:mitochondrial inner membrane protein COX18-like [Orbicella faveolata]|uniref:mitochondrial inner membrane protein COX18-like n=1 Tax=Orbicella faveolata TaxID=48498 RepID=UPI0009E40F81|nr:mitochondrial inner membrane protein COX18-like [Orbicella faveolata]